MSEQRQPDTFEAGGYTWYIEEFDSFTDNQRAVLMAFVELTLQKSIPPSTYDVTDWVVESGLTGMQSKRNVASVMAAVNFLHGRRLLTKMTQGQKRKLSYWPALLKVVPNEEFLFSEG